MAERERIVMLSGGAGSWRAVRRRKHLCWKRTH